MCGCNKAKALKATANREVPRNITVTRNGSVPVAVKQIVPPPLATVDTSVWGPSLWKILHIASMRSGNRNSVSLWRMIFEAMKTGLPCPDCSGHYNVWYRTHPLRIGLMPNVFQEAIIRWILDAHNDVNRRTGKPIWNIRQLTVTYGAENIITAKALADSLRGVIGANLSGALNALLRTL